MPDPEWLCVHRKVRAFLEESKRTHREVFACMGIPYQQIFEAYLGAYGWRLNPKKDGVTYRTLTNVKRDTTGHMRC